MKKVTPEQLIELVTPYLVNKMEANSHKGSPFELGHVYLSGRMDEELTEVEEAMLDYFDKKNEKTKRAFIDENVDVIDFAMYQIGKLLGCEVLVRGDDGSIK